MNITMLKIYAVIIFICLLALAFAKLRIFLLKKEKERLSNEPKKN